MSTLFGGVRAPSTLGSHLRSYTWGNVRQLEAVNRQLLAKLARRAPLLPGKDVLAFLDIDSMQKRQGDGPTDRGGSPGPGVTEGTLANWANWVNARGRVKVATVEAEHLAEPDAGCEQQPDQRPCRERLPRSVSRSAASISAVMSVSDYRCGRCRRAAGQQAGSVLASRWRAASGRTRGPPIAVGRARP
jgi:hypothetical protein